MTFRHFDLRHFDFEMSSSEFLAQTRISATFSTDVGRENRRGLATRVWRQRWGLADARWETCVLPLGRCLARLRPENWITRRRVGKRVRDWSTFSNQSAVGPFFNGRYWVCPATVCWRFRAGRAGPDIMTALLRTSLPRANEGPSRETSPFNCCRPIALTDAKLAAVSQRVFLVLGKIGMRRNVHKTFVCNKGFESSRTRKTRRGAATSARSCHR
jgi:hypothetical protein